MLTFMKYLLGLTLVFAISCTKKVKPETSGEGASSPGGIVTESMSYPAAGSDTGAIAGLSTINFAYDSSVLDSKARGLLKANADWMKANGKVTIQVEGHCDSRGSVEYNLALGERRAKAVKDYLASLGVDSKRMNLLSYGKEKPLDTGDSEDAHVKNRRANFVPL